MIQAHNNIEFIKFLVENNKGVVFFIHLDNKLPIQPEFEMYIKKQMNSFLLEHKDRVNVYWGGDSQIQATLKLINAAYEIKTVKYFHLISGECVPLISFSDMEKRWDNFKDINFIECRKRDEVNWRLRIRMFYCNTFFTRTFFGRVSNKIHKLLGTMINFTKWDDNNYWYGSQWFSINRDLISKIIDAEGDIKYFKRFSYITCCDEHAFQCFIKYIGCCNYTDENKRFIEFRNRKSSPEYITDVKFLEELSCQGYWFARKVTTDVAIDFIKGKK